MAPRAWRNRAVIREVDEMSIAFRMREEMSGVRFTPSEEVELNEEGFSLKSSVV